MRSFPLVALALAILSFGASGARAQAWARFEVPDSALAAAVRDAGAGYEGAWDALLVAGLRARAARADSAARLEALARRVASAESLATGGHIGAAALRRTARWSAPQRVRRVAGAVAESLATVAQRAREWDAARTRYAEALAHYRAIGEARRAAWVLGSLGTVAFTRGDLAAADSLYREALAARRALGDARLIGNALNTIGSTNLLLGRPEVAQAFLREARVVREATGERAALGTTLDYLGLAARALGQRDSAALWFERALPLTSAGGDSVRTAEALINFGALLSERGERVRARALLERALVNVTARGDRVNEATVRVALGEALRRDGRFAEAAASLDRAVALHQALGNPRPLVGSLTERGHVALDLEDGAAARPPLARAVALADSLGDGVGSALALNDLAIAQRLEGDAAGAARTATRALERARAAGDSALVHDAAATLGQLAQDARDWSAARGWYERAEGAGRAISAERHAADLVNLGTTAMMLGSLDGAEARYRAALALAADAQLPDIAWFALIGLGEAAERRGEPAAALAFTRRAATTIDTLRTAQGAEAPGITLLARRLFVFDALVHLLQKTAAATPGAGGDSLRREAFAWSERGRARALLDRLAESGAPARPVGLDEVRAALDPRAREALVAYSVGDSSTSAWVVTAAGWRHHVLPARAALRTRAEVLRRALADPERALSPAALEAARALYRMVVEPLERDLAGARRLIVVPDGPLARVPFEALLAADPRGGAVPRGGWLAERLALDYEPSASALVSRRARPGAGATADIVVLADPRFGAGPPALAPLPSTAAEAAALAALGGTRVTALTRADATRARLLAVPALARAGVIHLATHGTADEAEPARGGLWLAAPDSAAAPELLSVADVSRLSLAADLVTLSACESGLGRLERGEGVLGLSRAFLAAGAHSVVVSLWSVNDRSTAALMSTFYRELLAHGAARDRALATARRELLAAPATRSPFYWAPFVLVGDPGPLRRPH